MKHARPLNQASTSTSLISASFLIKASLSAALVISAQSSLMAAEPEGPETLITAQDALKHQLITKIKTNFRGKTGYDSLVQKRLKEFYLNHNREPVWLTNSGLTPLAKQTIAEIKKGHEYGLNVHDIKFPPQDMINGQPEQQADAELMFSRALLTYAKRAKAGNLVPQTVSRALDNTPDYPDPLNVLTSILDSKDLGQTLKSFHPKHPQYWALKEKLDTIRETKGTQKKLVRIPPGAVIRPFDRHPHIALLRERFEINVPVVDEVPLYPEDIYDSALVDAVKNFQAANGQRATGVINKTTRAKLNKGKPDQEKKILANMERWRWMPTEFGKTHIRVNIPEFKVRFTRNDKIVHTERVITGKRSQKTPSFSDEMETVVFNPYWNVPQSIIWNEMGGVAPRGYESRVVNGRLFIRQPPSPRNALGVIKFLFPNKHSVYLHDTPTKNLFNRKVRAFSHGCMRVRDPLKMAEFILEGNGINRKEIDKRIRSRRNQPVTLTNKIPVHVTYFTMWVNEDGSTAHYNDIYGHDRRVTAALEGRPMRLEPKQRINRQPVQMVKKKKKKPTNFITLFFN